MQKVIKNCKYQCHDVSGTHHTPHKQHHIHSNNKWCDWKGIPKCNTMANKDKGVNQVKPKGQWRNQSSSTFLTAAAEESSRKEVDRRSREVKLDTKISGNRCTDHRESKDKWPHVPDILCLCLEIVTDNLLHAYYLKVLYSKWIEHTCPQEMCVLRVYVGALCTGK